LRNYRESVFLEGMCLVTDAGNVFSRITTRIMFSNIRTWNVFCTPYAHKTV